MSYIPGAHLCVICCKRLKHTTSVSHDPGQKIAPQNCSEMADQPGADDQLSRFSPPVSSNSGIPRDLRLFLAIKEGGRAKQDIDAVCSELGPSLRQAINATSSLPLSTEVVIYVVL